LEDVEEGEVGGGGSDQRVTGKRAVHLFAAVLEHHEVGKEEGNKDHEACGKINDKLGSFFKTNKQCPGDQCTHTEEEKNGNDLENIHKRYQVGNHEVGDYKQ